MKSLGLILIHILNAISYSLLLALIASGLAIVFGVLKLVNFAHGSFYMMGAYIGYYLYQTTGQFFLSLILTPLVVAALGVLFQVSISGKVKKHDEMKYILLTFGLALVLENVVSILWGNNTRNVSPPDLLSGTVQIFGFNYPVYRLFVLAVSLLVCSFIYYLLAKTNIGIKIKASIEDGMMANALGININKLGLIVFAIGIGLSGFAGIISAPYAAISPHMGMSIIVIVFIIIVIGGMGSFLGAIIASFIIGFVQIIGGIFFPQYSLLLIYAVMIAILLVNKNGISTFLRNEFT